MQTMIVKQKIKLFYVCASLPSQHMQTKIVKQKIKLFNVSASLPLIREAKWHNVTSHGDSCNCKLDLNKIKIT
jgi:hypothetical protein